jgi:excisionase family DNA binding protein
MPITYWTVEEAAEHLGVARQRVYEWIYAGRLEALRCGSHWLIEESLVLSFQRMRVGRPRKKSVKNDTNSEPEKP